MSAFDGILEDSTVASKSISFYHMDDTRNDKRQIYYPSPRPFALSTSASTIIPQQSSDLENNLTLCRTKSLYSVTTIKLLSPSLSMLIETFDSPEYYDTILRTDPVNFLKLLIVYGRPMNFINYCIDVELNKSDETLIFRDNKGIDNCISYYLREAACIDKMIIRVIKQHFIKRGSKISDRKINSHLFTLLTNIFKVINELPPTVKCLFDYIKAKADEKGKDGIMMIVKLLFLKVINPIIIDFRMNHTRSATKKDNLLAISKRSQEIANSLCNCLLPSDELQSVIEIKKLILNSIQNLKCNKRVIFTEKIDMNYNAAVILFCNLLHDSEFTDNHDRIKQFLLKVLLLIKMNIKKIHINPESINLINELDILDATTGEHLLE
jgi:hypothetical protein